MAIAASAGSPKPALGTVNAALRDVFAGAICSVVSISFGLSYAALIFNGPLTPYIAFGIAATFISSSVAAFVVALGSSLPFAIAGPDSSTVAITAALIAALSERLTAAGAPDRLLEASLITLPISAALAALLLWGVGAARASRAIRFIPYPVIGGFLGATGWLVVSGACRIMTGQRLTLSSISTLTASDNELKLLAAAAVAVTLFAALRRVKNPFMLPGVLLAFVALTYAVTFLTGTSVADLQISDWMFRSPGGYELSVPWHLDEFDRFPWGALPSLSGDLIAVVFVTVISVLLNVTGIEVTTHQEADLDRELKALGIANLLTAALGGYVTCISVTRSVLNRASGATSRLSGITVGVICALMLAVDPAFLGYVPKFVLGGLLFYLGGLVIYQWLINAAFRLSFVEYLSLLAIVVIIVGWGFIAGILSGIVIGCATFALSASRINAIKFSFDGSEYRSSLDRAPDELALLTRMGSQIQGMSLHSYLFFGSANRLYQHVKALLARNPDCRYLLFDFRLVTGLDSSATHSFSQIKRAADRNDTRLVLVNLGRDLEKAFRTIRFISDDIVVVPNLDRALEFCEDALINSEESASTESKSLHQWFAEALGSNAHAEELAGLCHRVDVAAGDIIARQGDAADAMHFILDGRVGILVQAGSNTIRVRSLGRQTTVGEMGLISRQPRSATIEAEVPSVLYALSIEAYERIGAENPALSQALLSYIVKVMAERLSFASRVIGVLQR